MRRLLVLTLAACAGDDAAPDLLDTGDAGTFRVVFLADPHVIGDDYLCCESPGLDTESIYKSRRRLETARELINAIEPAPERGFVLGDVFHQNYKLPEVADYADPVNGSAAYHAQQLLRGFGMPMSLLWGNHDYSVPEFSREFSHQLFREMFETEPYHAVDLKGWKFLATNSQLGRTWDADPMNAFLRTGAGSFGREQLQWMAEQLDEGKPTFLLFHHHPIVLESNEDPDGPWPDIFALVDAYKDRIAGILVGHLHLWLDISGAFDGVPAYVVGSTRYDADNFWLFELDEDGADYRVLDRDKASWGSNFGYPGRYDGQAVGVDLTADPEDDPAGPWDGWMTPPPWPPDE